MPLSRKSGCKGTTFSFYARRSGPAIYCFLTYIDKSAPVVSWFSEIIVVPLPTKPIASSANEETGTVCPDTQLQLCLRATGEAVGTLVTDCVYPLRDPRGR